MLLQIHGVGNQKIPYKDANNVQFDDLGTYLTLAKKAISKFANGIYNGLASKMLKDEDAISSVANAIMMADWRWDENYENARGTKKTKYSYRNQCALWAIQTYTSKSYKKPKKINKIYSLDHELENHDGTCVYNYMSDTKSLTPDENIINSEDKQCVQKLVQDMLSIDCLSEKQKDYIRLYYFENYTFEKIGKKYGITREAVRQGLNKALLLIRSYANS